MLHRHVSLFACWACNLITYSRWNIVNLSLQDSSHILFYGSRSDHATDKPVKSIVASALMQGTRDTRNFCFIHTPLRTPLSSFGKISRGIARSQIPAQWNSPFSSFLPSFLLLHVSGTCCGLCHKTYFSFQTKWGRETVFDPLRALMRAPRVISTALSAWALIRNLDDELCKVRTLPLLLINSSLINRRRKVKLPMRWKHHRLLTTTATLGRFSLRAHFMLWNRDTEIETHFQDHIFHSSSSTGNS